MELKKKNEFEKINYFKSWFYSRKISFHTNWLD